VETESQHAPPVVAVVLVHDPGEWFDECLDAFADQDYPNLRFLFLAAGIDEESGGEAASEDPARSGDVVPSEVTIESRVKVRLPDAFVRRLNANTGFGPSVNEVLRLVEGDNGFFLFSHDDVAPEPDAIRAMVEELYRSNAGVVGPKLTEWDDPGVLQSVGLGLDRFGEVDQVVEPGEVDQEQHDGVRDVFVLPSSFLLVRADLFRELDGFDPAIDYYGDDIEFCWRVHHSGARVVVAPAARVRHRRDLPERRPDLNPLALEARHRMRTVVTLTGRARLPGRIFELILLTLSELVVGLFTGKFRQAWASTRALFGLIPRIPSITARRRAIKPLRRVPEREVLGLQQRGSARLNSYLRSRDTATYVGADANIRRWRQSTTAPVIAWFVVLAALFIGSRSVISNGIPAVGEFLRFPESPRMLLESFLSGWNPNGAGATSDNPTGWATISALSVFTLFRMGLLHTLFILGLVVVGLIGLWKLATVFPSTRARIAALLVYAATPLMSGALAIGSLNTLVAYAATPWFIHTLRRAVGVETADPRAAQLDLVDGLIDLPWPERLRRTLQAALVLGLAAAFTPVVLVIALAAGLLLAIGTLIAFAPWRTAMRYVLLTVGAVAAAGLLNFPWITSWSWESLVGPSPIGDPSRGLLSVASFEIGPTDFAYLALALYLPVVAAVALARAWRLTWAIRSAALVIGFGAVAVLGDQGRLPFQPPEAGVLLAPVAVGLAISAASALAAFDLDVRGGTFGWRQPLGLAASAAVVVGLVPGILAIGDGSWGMPTTPLSTALETKVTGEGDYRTLLVGDARLLPVPSTEYRDGISFALIDSRELDTRARWASPDTPADEAIIFALDQIADGSTLRSGQLLTPLGIRYIAVPQIDGVVSTTADPIEPPAGLVDALDRQLDIRNLFDVDTYELYEVADWLSISTLLQGEAAEATTTAGADAILSADLRGAVPIFPGADNLSTSVSSVDSGAVHLAVPFDENWKVDVDDESVAARRAFGTTTAYDVAGGVATLRYSTPPVRSLLVAFELVLWLVAAFGAARVTVPLARRRGPLISDETLIHLDEPEIGFDPGLDMSGNLARPDLDGDLVDDETTLDSPVGSPEPDAPAPTEGAAP